jgi:sterol desaturase/sphingolipid hydroxylase (fatty acid hydroxylase superfamily)
MPERAAVARRLDSGRGVLPALVGRKQATLATLGTGTQIAPQCSEFSDRRHCRHYFATSGSTGHTLFDPIGGTPALGFSKKTRLPLWADVTLAVVLLDYTFYLWHALNHKVPFLWRFHQPHHVDLGLDTSTALRFHFGELSISVGWRASQILLIGVSPFALSVWQLLMLVEIMFHHSNLKLPIRTERVLSKLIVTPRLHGIHHSIIKQEQESNWSSGLTVWDYLHGTLRENIPQSELTMGVPAYLDPTDTDFADVVVMPFHEQRDSWRPPNGKVPTRSVTAVPANRLLA